MRGASARRHWGDGIAIAASALCLVHCLVLPMAILLLPAAALWLALPESLHAWLLGLTLPVSGAALIIGFRRHRHAMPLAIAGAGLLCLAVAVLLARSVAGETGLTVIGSTLLIAGHLINRRGLAS